MRQSLLLATLGLVACGHEPTAVGLTGADDHSVTVPVGGEVSLTTVTVGPGEYESPPAISPAILRFVTVEYVGPYTPGGPRQQFHFAALAPGQAVVRFHHTGYDPDVVDTVVVR